MQRNQHVSIKHQKELKPYFPCRLAQGSALYNSLFLWSESYSLVRQPVPGAVSLTLPGKCKLNSLYGGGSVWENLDTTKIKDLQEPLLKEKGARKDAKNVPFFGVQSDLKGCMQIKTEVVFDPNWADFKCFLKS